MFGILKTLAGVNLAESIVDNCIRDKVPHPDVGAVVYCDLAFGYAEHSGIYVGGNEIIHLNSKGWVEYVTPEEFTDGTTAISIYTTCRNGKAIGDDYAADNARRFERDVSVKKYNVLLDNCHMFSSACLSGNIDNSDSFLWMLKHTAEKELMSNEWRVWDTSKRFGALAYSKGKDQLNYSWAAESAESAKRAALRNAEDDAKIVQCGSGKWIAVADNGVKVGFDCDDSKNRACENAKKACGNSNARIRLCFSTIDGFKFKPT